MLPCHARYQTKRLLLALCAVLPMLGSACRTSDKGGAQLDEAASSQGTRAPINSTILLFGDGDWNKGNGRCRALVDAALGSQNFNDTLNFVPTQFGILDASGNGKMTICRSSGSSNKACAAMDNNAIAAFKEGMSDCFAYAVKKGRELYGKPLNLSMLPHIDDGTGAGNWRNNMKFDPTPTGTDCSQNPQFSYYCTMVKPLAEAVAATIEPAGKVYFSMQGEMGATVFAYPQSYHRIMPALRQILTSSQRSSDADVLIGLSLNYTRVAGDYFAGDRQDAAALFDDPGLGFLGVSSYGELTYKPSPLEFDFTMDTFAGELSFVGVSLEKLQNRGVQMHFSETALGGGNILGQAVAHAWQTSSSPWAGVGGEFSFASTPWSKPDLVKLQEDFYCAQMTYLSGTIPTRWKVQRSFIWNGGSWDIQGLSASSNSSSGSSRNAKVMEWMVAYNKTGQLTCPVQQKPVPHLPNDVVDDFSTYGNDLELLKRTYTYYPKAMGMQDIQFLQNGAKGIHVTYKLGTGMWDHRAGIWLHGPFKWQDLQKQGLALTMKMQDGVKLDGKKMTFGLRERSGEYWEAAVPVSTAQNGVLKFPFASLKAPELDDNGSGDRVLDLNDVFSFYLLLSDDQGGGASESYDLTRLELY